MIDVATAVLFFGFPIVVALLGWIAVKVYEWRTSPARDEIFATHRG